MIRWLHISDLHLGDDEMISSLLRDELPRFLREQNFQFNYLFVTGDIRTAYLKSNDFTREMAGFLKSLCEDAGVATNNLFIVPGNHDVNRDSSGRDDAIKRIMFQRSGYYDPSVGKVDSNDLDVILQGEKDFINFLSLLYEEDRLSLYGNSLAPHFNVETEDFNILHLDSTIVYMKGQEANDLIVGTKYVYNALKKINGNKPTILLTHYPLTSFLQSEKKCISKLLFSHGVKLWLAGHEHDHILQHIQYIESLQAGELRYEEKSKATFLVGEYNPSSYQCKVSAYTWFDEGWAKYPIINLESNKKDVYEFLLKPIGEGGFSIETKLAQKLNQSFYCRLPNKLEKTLFPQIESDGQVFTLEVLLTESWNTPAYSVILLADGGMGKSTMLLNYCKNSQSPVLYVPAERLATLGIGIEEYCVNYLYSGDYESYREALFNKHKEPSLKIVIDGLNEVDGANERKFINDILRINMLKGVQLIVASRSDFTMRYSMPGFHRAVLCPLEDSNIRGFFTEDEWVNIKDTETLNNLLRNAMMVTVYREICSVIEEYRNVEFLDWILPVKNASDLFHNYYVAQIALMMRRGTADGKKIMLAMACIYKVLPGIAYAYEKSYSLNKTNAEFRDILANIVGTNELNEDFLQVVREYYREFGDLNLEIGAVTDMLTCDLHLLHRESFTTNFSHQIYRDFLSAQWIIKESNNLNNVESLWNTREFSYPVMEHIRRCSGFYWDGIAKNVHLVGICRDDAQILIQNLFDCFPSSYIGGVANYSRLNLSNLQLPINMILSDKISLQGTTIDKQTLGLFSGNPLKYTNLCFSPDSTFLVAAADRDIHIFFLKESHKPFVYNIGKKAAKMVFCDNKLFINAGSIIIFSYNGEWRYIGEIQSKDGNVTRKLHSLLVKDDILHFYYTNREVCYRLSDCSRMETITGKDCGKNSVDGYNLSSLRQTVSLRPSKELSNEVIATAKGDKLCATSYGDGRLEITSGKELVSVLARGITILMDAAISGDGTRAVTLSFATFDDRRRIQIWDLDQRIKIKEIYCHHLIKKIHLSETGQWLLGETLDLTWTYNFNEDKEKWYKEHFVSNQHGRLVTYGENVLRKDRHHNLFLFNLTTEESIPQNSPFLTPRLVCFLNDGTIAAVNETGRILKFKSCRDGEVLTIYGDGAEILSIQSFKSQPFIAVATSDELISIYHVGNGKRVRILKSHNEANIVVVHPTLTVIAHSDGYHYLAIKNYYEKYYCGQPRGWWYDNLYKEEPKIDSNILDMAFNGKNHFLVIIMANGRIQFLHEKYCKYESSFQIITAFNIDAYNFNKSICSSELTEVLKRNGAMI